MRLRAVAIFVGFYALAALSCARLVPVWALMLYALAIWLLKEVARD